MTNRLWLFRQAATLLLLGLARGGDTPQILETQGAPVVQDSRTKYDTEIQTGGSQSTPYASVRTLSGTSDQGHPFQRAADDTPDRLYWPEGLRASKTSPWRSLGQPQASQNSPETAPQFWRPEAVAMHPAGSVLAVAGDYTATAECH